MTVIDMEAKVAESADMLQKQTRIDESKLTDEQKKALEEFRSRKEVKVKKEVIEGWFKRIADIDMNTLSAFIEELSNVEHDYYSTISAATCIALASVKAFNKNNVFKDKNQGLKIANSIYASMTGIGDKPFRVYEFYTILDPKCDGDMNSIPMPIFAALRTKADELLKEHPNAEEIYKKRWKQVRNGKLPDNWVVRGMKGENQ